MRYYPTLVGDEISAAQKDFHSVLAQLEKLIGMLMPTPRSANIALAIVYFLLSRNGANMRTPPEALGNLKRELNLQDSSFYNVVNYLKKTGVIETIGKDYFISPALGSNLRRASTFWNTKFFGKIRERNRHYDADLLKEMISEAERRFERVKAAFD